MYHINTEEKNNIILSYIKKGFIMAYINLGQVMYPVGAIYQSWSSTSPASLFGGQWTQITEKFLYCSNSAGGTGGASNVTLNISQIPSHQHTVRYKNPKSNETFPHPWENGGGGGGFCLSGTWTSNKQDDLIALSTGGGQAHENMPPYIRCYTWRRHA